MDMSHINLSLDDIKTVVQKHYALTHQNCPDFTTISYKFKKLSEEPVGFLGDHYLLEVCFNTAKSTITDPLSFFVKILPETSQCQTEYIEGFGAFSKEVQLYENLLPRLQKCEIGAWGPRCLLTKGNKLIVLEDLSQAQFQGSLFTDGTLDYYHMVVALKSLARFHASSIVLENETGQCCKDLYAEELKENAYPKTEGVRLMGFRNACSALSDLIKLIPKYENSPRLDFILKKFLTVMQKIYKFAETSTTYRNIVLHADLWTNNVMFKYEKSKGSENNQYPPLLPVDARLVDFQLARYAPPAMDVTTLITIPSNSSFREKHFQQLTKEYYGALTDELKANNIELAEQMSAPQFYASCEHFKLAGLIESALFGHLTLLPPEISKEVVATSESFENFIKNSRNEICVRAFKTCENYRYRMTDLLMEIIDVYVLEL